MYFPIYIEFCKKQALQNCYSTKEKKVAKSLLHTSRLFFRNVDSLHNGLKLAVGILCLILNSIAFFQLLKTSRECRYVADVDRKRRLLRSEKRAEKFGGRRKSRT